MRDRWRGLEGDLVSYSLTLRPGLRWHISAGNDAVAPLVAQMAEVMQLPSHEDAGGAATGESTKRLVVVSNGHTPAQDSPDDVICRLTAGQPGWKELFRGQVQASLALARAFLPQGGLLLHGALAERLGQGMVCFGSSGAGKTTASRRLPAPWHSLCDDTTLVTPDTEGRWWAHPWPTWSLCIEGGPGGHWNVPSALPLRAIFHLKQAPLDTVTPLGAGQAAARLMQAAEEASPLAAARLAPEKVHQLRLQRFEWLSALVRAVPAFTLELTLAGAFWHEIEKAMGWDTRLV